jgi:hypothetical protein
MKQAIARTATFVSFFVLLIAETAHAQSAIPVHNCTTIWVSGSYVVTDNLAVTPGNVQTDAATSALTCIDIAADFVTLDLAGHTIFGPPGTRLNGDDVYGIFTFQHNAIEVRSGALTRFVDGIGFSGNGFTIEKIRAFNNSQVGINIVSGSGHRIVGNTAMGNLVNGIAFTCPAVAVGNAADGNGSLQISGQGTGCTQADNSPAP